MKIIYIAIITVLLSGCSDSTDLQAAINEFTKNCSGTISAKFIYSSWSKGLELTCNEINKSGWAGKEKHK